MKTILPAPRIAANDPTLAHALVRHVTERDSEVMLRRFRALMPRPSSRSVPKIATAVQRAFGALMLLEYIGRAHGSRANATWLTLINNVEGDFIPLFFQYKAQRLNHYFLRYRVTHHAVARMAQRTLGVADLQRAAPVIGGHIRTLIPMLGKLEDECPEGRKLVEVRSATTEGCFLWRLDDGEWVAGTWLDPQSASDDTVRTDCIKAAEQIDVGYIRITKIDNIR